MATGNSVNDEIKEQHRKILDSEGFKGRLTYFFYYYKWHVLISLVLIIFAVTFIYGRVTQKDTILQVIMVNGFPNIEAETIMEDFNRNITMNPKKEQTLLDTSFYINTDSPTMFDEQNSEKLFVMSAAGVVDVVLANKDYFLTMAETGYLLDMSKILTDEQMQQYKDRFLYYDSPNNYAEGEELVGIDVTDSPLLKNTQSYPNDQVYFCIIMNSSHTDLALTFLEYLDEPR